MCVEVFPQYRGRGINQLMTEAVLAMLAKEGMRRAFLDIHTANVPSIASFTRTSFRRLGVVRSWQVFGNAITVWYLKEC
jgi:RimJ/RimL family protein N-acetyltransferase